MSRENFQNLFLTLSDDVFPAWPCLQILWETDFYTPPVLGGAALFDNSAPAVYKIQGTGFLYTAGAELSTRAAAPSTGGV